MKTVKEVSVLTGISVRTLHWYDEIGLLKPSAVSDAGYRLYDDKALERLQQILFFREFDLPLREIKSIMDNPALDRNHILLSQRRMLEQKKERLERLISGIDDILKGENRMDFTVFDQNDIEQLYQSIMSQMTDEQKKQYMKNYILADECAAAETSGAENVLTDMEEVEAEFHKMFVRNASGEQAQKNFRKLVEWYGDKEQVLKGAKPMEPEIFAAYQNRLDAVLKKLAAKRGEDVSGFPVRELIGEYDFVSGQLYQMRDVKVVMKDLAAFYQANEQAKAAFEKQYGEGFVEFFAAAVEEFYK
ncbi:MerR family transcriptional regulator [Marvinbryantia sp.]|uniref:MerR family transcriptional regulator n=1 Tax=Marvinbryantia sp. TaxID=2496532 RepID=UPI0025DCF58F|nr:MerR family transcriptional regulator [uncultured Marvinbryantia sp.]